MSENDKWNNFLKNGSVLAYLSYLASKKPSEGSEKNSENQNSGLSNQGNTHWGK